jgi:hypothetical protein
MESYDEYSRRARIMTEVHALPTGSEGKLSADSAGTADSSEAETAKQAVQKKKEKDAKKKVLKRL